MKKRAILCTMILVLTIGSNEAVFADNAGLTSKDAQPILMLDSTSGTKSKFTPIKESEIVQPQDVYIEKVLNVSAIGQETSYYCGPASAEQLLKYKGITSNPKDGRSTTQNNLAKDLGTTTSGTPFTGTWASTLANWTGVSWSSVWGPSETTLWNDTKADIDVNYPLIYDTHMNATNGYLPGYTSGEIYHYVTGDGYKYHTYYPDKFIHYVDPNKFRSEAYGPHWVMLNLMYNVVKDRGIVW